MDDNYGKNQRIIGLSVQSPPSSISAFTKPLKRSHFNHSHQPWYFKHRIRNLKALVELEKMASFAVDVKNVAMEVMGAITESLGLSNSYMREKLEDGMQVMAINCYPPCPQPDRVLGLPPHTDYSFVTILLQSGQGLQVMSTNEEEWRLIADNHGVLHVQVGDFLEVLSNGSYKSVVHRATLNSEKTRYSIASLHSYGMDEKVETAKELVDEQHPKGYKGSSFRDFLKFLSTNDIAEGSSFIENLKIKS
ncbi:hypothetical protein MKW94_024188 [Papaver nudicaule]|uniref:Fe2OG dioxygenase domain-containing protein n=1 Tax=Papaver nudicaule TaxID=74823 RepID=A0AA41S4V7_PAPNU|nr:hypothetical protein [Papaver nudicaule]